MLLHFAFTWQFTLSPISNHDQFLNIRDGNVTFDDCGLPLRIETGDDSKVVLYLDNKRLCVNASNNITIRCTSDTHNLSAEKSNNYLMIKKDKQCLTLVEVEGLYTPAMEECGWLDTQLFALVDGNLCYDSTSNLNGGLNFTDYSGSSPGYGNASNNAPVTVPVNNVLLKIPAAPISTPVADTPAVRASTATPITAEPVIANVSAPSVPVANVPSVPVSSVSNAPSVPVSSVPSVPVPSIPSVPVPNTPPVPVPSTPPAMPVSGTPPIPIPSTPPVPVPSTPPYAPTSSVPSTYNTPSAIPPSNTSTNSSNPSPYTPLPVPSTTSTIPASTVNCVAPCKLDDNKVCVCVNVEGAVRPTSMLGGSNANPSSNLYASNGQYTNGHQYGSQYGSQYGNQYGSQYPNSSTPYIPTIYLDDKYFKSLQSSSIYTQCCSSMACPCMPIINVYPIININVDELYRKMHNK